MKKHKHHIKYRSQGGSNHPSNLLELDFIEHARLHALDFISGGQQFDFRHEGWPHLEPSLQKLVKREHSKRVSIRNRLDNPMRKEGVLKRVLSSRRRYTGKNNPFFSKKHTLEARAKMSSSRLAVNPKRRSQPIILIHKDGLEEKFNSSIEACLKYNLSPGDLSGVLNGKVPHTKGFRAKRP